MSSTPVLDAASISITSMGAPETKSRQEGQAPQASAPLRCVHDSALARRRAVVVLPAPRAVKNTRGRRGPTPAFCSVRDRILPRRRRHLRPPLRANT
jgi:hypothetical protein